MASELWNTERVRLELGASSIRSVSVLIRRMGLVPVSREPGRDGMNLYDAAEVAEKIAARRSQVDAEDPTEGPLTDQKPSPENPHEPIG